MFTIFSIPKPFVDSHINVIQTNAIRSWLNLASDIEVILCGNDSGVEEICRKYNIQHINNVECTESGTPLLSSAFNLVREKAKYDVLVFINADIILTDDFLKIFDFLPKQDFLIVGRRWDLDIVKLLDFSRDWQGEVNKLIKKEGALHAPAGSDYFIFKKESFKNLPPFAVGRIGWDNWMLKESLAKDMMVIDASPIVKVVHQNHDYRRKLKNAECEDKKNVSLTGMTRFWPTLRNVKYQFGVGGIKRSNVFLKNYNQIILMYIYNSMIKILELLKSFFYLVSSACKRMVKIINARLFYLEQSECQKKSDCKLLADLLYNQPPNSDRYLEYPWLLQNIKIANGKILDVGSTASNMLYNFLPKSVEISSIDLNAKHIESPNVKFSVGDIRKTDYPDECFDIISCISTLEHIGVSGRYGSDDDKIGDLKAVKEMRRILKRGGSMLVTVPYGIRDVLPINKLYNKERIAELFAGFSSVEITYKKYFKQFGLWLDTDESEAGKTDMLKDLWYAIAFIKVTK